MNRPNLIVADEPTGNLDERTGNEVVDLLLGLCQSANTALILVTHNAAHAAKTRRSLFLTAGALGEG
jgi:predicted ABC-type transport system involved in lysophospholipase L1 biosynthesis ATPase subunit